MALLLTVTALSFAPALKGAFVWDDTALVEHNPAIRSFSHFRDNLTGHFWRAVDEDGSPDRFHVYYRPLVTLSYMLDYQIYGLNPHGFHLTNLLLHLLAALAALWFLGNLLGRRSVLPLLATLLFVLHPTRAESVSWIAGRTDVLMTLFALVALGSFWRALLAEASGLRRRWAAAGWLALGCALLTKETAIALLVVLPALDWLLVSHRDKRQFFAHARWLHAPLALVVLAFLFVWLWVQPSLRDEVIVVSWLSWIKTVLQSLGHYAALVVDPYQPSGQIAPLFRSSQANAGMMLLGGAFLAAGLLALVWSWRRSPRAALGLLITAAFLAPVSNLIPMRMGSLVYERFLYLPFLGICLLLALGLGWLFRRTRHRFVWFILLGALVSSWALTSHSRSKDFQDPLRFWRAETRSSPESALAHVELGDLLAAQRRYAEAQASFVRAVEAWEGSGIQAWYAISAILKIIDLQALLVPANEQSYLRQADDFLGRLVSFAQEPPSPDNRAALKLGPGQAIALAVDTEKLQETLQKMKFQILSQVGAIRSRLGLDAAAVAALEEAARLQPKRLTTWLNLALAQARALDLAAAQQSYRQGRRLLPEEPELERLAKSLQIAEQRLQSLRDLGLQGSQLEEPLASDPRAQRLLAELYIVTRASGRAIAHLRQVVRLAPEDRQGWSMLALELAAAGDLPGAQQVIGQARQQFGDEPGLAALEQKVQEVTPHRRALQAF